MSNPHFVFFLILTFFAVPNAEAGSHGGRGRLSTGDRILIGTAGALTGYAIGKAIRNHRDAAARANYERSFDRGGYNNSNYDEDDDDGGYYIPSPVARSAPQKRITESAASDAVKDLNERMLRSNSTATFAALTDGKTPQYACYGLCGGYWNGENYDQLSYDVSYYGQALQLAPLFGVGDTREQAFENLKRFCPDFKYKLVNAAGYSEKIAYKESLKEAKAEDVCFENIKGEASCTANCVATRKADPKQSVVETFKSSGQTLAEAFLGAYFNQKCLVKYGATNGPFLVHIDHAKDKGKFMTPQNSCNVDPGKTGEAPKTIVEHPAEIPGEPSGKAFTTDSIVRCDGMLCDQIKAAPEDKNCVQGVQKPGDDDHAWFQFSDGVCPANNTLRSAAAVKFELKATSEPDPGLTHQAQDPATAERLRSLGIPIPKSGKILWTNPQGEEVQVGTWFEVHVGSENYPIMTSLCGKKQSLALPGFGTEPDFSKVCRIAIRDGRFTGIEPASP